MNKVLVIGLDGVPLDLIRAWADAGEMPTLKRILSDGASGHLRSTMPPTSAAAWSSFMTGKNPGRTGVYDFLYRQEGDYTFAPINGRRREGPSLWRLLSDAGRRVGVINVPMSYPAEAVNGFMISGWMTPFRSRDFAYPAGLMRDVQAAVGDYHIYPQETFSEQRKDAYLAASHEMLEMRTKTALHLMANKPWDFFMLVYFDTDRILHQLWHYLDADHPWRKGQLPGDASEPIRQYFRHLDTCIGRLLQEAGEEVTLMIMSDHGMGSAHNMIVLNNWLLESGWLHLKEGATARIKHALFQKGFTLKNIHELVDRLGLARHAEYKALYSVDAILKRLFLSFNDVDWSRSRAYSYGRHVGPLFLNVSGREPQGIITPGAEYERERDALAEQALEMRDPISGKQLVGKVLYREDVYHGEHLKEAPDLILIPREETDIFFGLSDFGSNKIMQPMYRYSGMHRDDGLVMMMGPNIQQAQQIEGAHIVDLAPTILYAMGVPIPTDMDGRPLGQAFVQQPAAEIVTRPAPRNGANGSNGSSGHDVHNNGNGQQRTNGYTREEALSVEQRLRAMGYLG